MIQAYESPEAFRQALEQRIRAASKTEKLDMSRYRQVLIFDRFLAKVFAEFGDRVIVKGGVVLELRLERARTTRDVDLRVMGDPTKVFEQLRKAGELDLGDFLTFDIESDPDHPTIEGEGIVYGGQRFRAQGKLAGKAYGMRFGVDAGFGDVLTMDPEIVTGTRFFDFVGAKAAQHRVYPRVAHIAEKLHAYTLPRRNENSRVKDLPDLALLAQTGDFTGIELRDAIDATFEFRKTHAVPSELPPPPTSWKRIYEKMAVADELAWSTIEQVFEAASTFLNPVLDGTAASWDPKRGVWNSQRFQL